MARASFKSLITPTDGLPVLVDFFADWCGPCKAMAPALEQVARQLAGQVRVLKVNVDRNPAAAQQYGVQSIPTLILFRDGRPVWRQSGALSADQILRGVRPNVPAPQ